MHLYLLMLLENKFHKVLSYLSFYLHVNVNIYLCKISSVIRLHILEHDVILLISQDKIIQINSDTSICHLEKVFLNI